MAILFPNGFKITSNEPIDSRMILTKAEMLSIKKAQMPSLYFCICPDDGKLYIYDASIEPSAETGYFKTAKVEGEVQWGKLGGNS